ncbi:MAG: hypothetical protein Q9188_004610 [Gyalolechia gomerana]
MAKKRKPLSNPPTSTAMDLDHPSPSHRPQKSLLSANTNAGVSKPTKTTRLPRGKGRRAQRLRKEKAGARAEEVKGRTERKVERSFGKGRRRGERNAKWEDMNEKIKGALVEGRGTGNVRERGVGQKEKASGEEEWVDEVDDEGMVEGGAAAEGVEEIGYEAETGAVRSGGNL